MKRLTLCLCAISFLFLLHSRPASVCAEQEGVDENQFRLEDYSGGERVKKSNEAQGTVSTDEQKRQIVERYFDDLKQVRNRGDSPLDGGSGTSQDQKKSRVVTPDYQKDYEQSLAPPREKATVDADRPAILGEPSSDTTTANQSHNALVNVKDFVRGTSSTPTTTSAEEADDSDWDRGEKSILLRVGLLGGYSQVSSTNANVQNTWNQQALGQNLYLGFLADLETGKYLGTEVDAFWGVSPKNTLVDNKGGETEVSSQHRGGMLSEKLQLPIPMGGFAFVPSIGLGYGLLSLWQENRTASTDDTSDTSVRGPFWIAGIAIVPSKSLNLSVDYACSFNAITNGTIGGPSPSGQFSRLRLAGYVRIYSRVLLGAQYLQRTMTISDTDALRQFLGALIYEF